MKFFFAGICAVLIVCAQALSQPQSLGPKDTLASAGLSKQEINQVIEAIEQSAYDTPESWEAELRVRKLALGSATAGSMPGLVVQGSKLLCGATGNCQTWVLRKVGGKWSSLIAGDQAPIAESFEFGPGSSSGIKNLTLVANSSAESSSRVTYKFDGKVYRAK
jgi:hypothetical protein